MGGPVRINQVKHNATSSVSASAANPVYMTPGPMGDIASGGAYSIDAATGIMAAGLSAASEIFQFRWTAASATMVALVRSVIISAGNNGTAFAAGIARFGLWRSTAWSVAGTGGGALTITTTNGKKRVGHAVTSLGEGRVATTTALGAGTKTLDAHPLSQACVGIPAVAGQHMIGPYDLLVKNTDDNYPLMLKNNEGFSVMATVPATGTWQADITVIWDEVPAYGI